MWSRARKKGKENTGPKKVEDFKGTHVAKQNVTLWTYGNGGNTAVPAPILKGDLIEVMCCHSYLLPIAKQFIKSISELDFNISGSDRRSKVVAS